MKSSAIADFRCVLAMIVVYAAAGCGGVVRVPVNGLITLDGVPVDEAAVTFMPTVSGRPGLAMTDSAGRFFVREAGMENGLTPGTYDVVVFKVVWAPVNMVPAPMPVDHPDGAPVPMVDVPGRNPEIARYIVPKRYTKPETSGLRVSVKQADKNLTFALTTAP